MQRLFLFIWALATLIAGAPALARPVVAVIDSGVARTAELGEAVIAEYDVASTTPRAAFQPRFDHGTMVATIIHREARGNVDLISLRMDDPAGCPPGFNPPCQFSALPIAAAIRKAVDLGVDAINISLALQEHPAIVAAVREAAEKGIMVVMAAGNNGDDHPSNRSAALAGGANAVLVGAVDSAGQPWVRTNRPETVNAPGYAYVWRLGVMVPTTSAAGAAVAGTGTSFAAPIETAHRVLAIEARRSTNGPWLGLGAGIGAHR
ncbi:MAG: S8 family serine peptidase [Sphingomonadaceae bacterium]|nr:S8 family serine peptidase [Sphingomonadaceae bacterium]